MNKRIVTSFGGHIRSLRETSGVPIKKIAEQLGMDPSLLGKIERNERQPTKDLILKIAKLYNQDERFLMKHFISDQFAYKILEEEADIEILKFAEEKVRFHVNQLKK